MSSIRSKIKIRLSRGYKYNALDISKNEIRLLSLKEVQSITGATSKGASSSPPDGILECSLTHVPLPDAQKYVALSYTWGTGPDDHIIRIDGHKRPVSSNLWQALLHLFKNGYRTVWVDALCINQKDNEEKARQIVRLHQVFQGAETVVAWVGCPDLHSKTIIDLLKADSRVNRGILDSEFKQWKDALEAFAARDYWSRVWIVQEFAVAPHVVIMCGLDTISLLSLQDLVEAYDSFSLRPHALSLQPIATLLSIRDWREAPEKVRLVDILRQTTVPLNPGVLEESQRELKRLFKSTDIADQVYGLLGLVDDAEIFVADVDYNVSMNALLINMTKSCISKTRRLDFILLEPAQKNMSYTVLGCQKHRNYRPSELPSWCPDWVNIADSYYSSEILSPVFEESAIYMRRLEQRMGKKRQSFCATNGSHLKNESWKFEESRRLLIEGVPLGAILAESASLDSGNAHDLKRMCRTVSDLFTTYSLQSCLEPQLLADAIRQVLSGPPIRDNDGSPSRQRLATLDVFGRDSSLGQMLTEYVNKLSPNLTNPTEGVVALSHEIIRCVHINVNLFGRKFVRYRPIESKDGKFPPFECIGWAPKTAVSGDHIWLLRGCSLPVVLRDTKETGTSSKPAFLKVGPAVINDVMFGENWPGAARTEISTIAQVCIV